VAGWRKICCGVDFSALSRLAMDQSAYLARTYEAELTLVHVFDRPAAGETGSTARALHDAEAKLASWCSQAQFLAERRVRAVVLTGHPADELVAFAREGGFDLVVLGTKGSTGLKHLLLGSVAERVVRLAPCAVLVSRHLPAPVPGAWLEETGARSPRR
jgi:universal stress protein A